jgi:hypothetical protein
MTFLSGMQIRDAWTWILRIHLKISKIPKLDGQGNCPMQLKRRSVSTGEDKQQFLLKIKSLMAGISAEKILKIEQAA